MREKDSKVTGLLGDKSDRIPELKTHSQPRANMLSSGKIGRGDYQRGVENAKRMLFTNDEVSALSPDSVC